MRPFIKYPTTLFVLLLIGYSQLFAPLFMRMGVFPTPSRNKIESGKDKVLIVKKTEAEAIFLEEEEAKEEKEDEHDSLKKYSDYSSVFSHTHLQQYFFRQNISYSSFSKHFSSFSSLRSPYLVFRVFRL